MTNKLRGPGRPPAPPLSLDLVAIADLRKLAKELAKDHSKLKSFLTAERMFHVLFQNHLATMEIPGDRGIIVNAEASKRFMEFSEPLLAALKGVEGEEEPAPKKGRK